MYSQKEEKIDNLQEQVNYAEQRLAQFMQKAEALPKIEEELASRVAALNEVGPVNSSSTLRQIIRSSDNRADKRQTLSHDKKFSLSYCLSLYNPLCFYSIEHC